MKRIMDKNFDNIILQEIKKTNTLFLDIGAGEAESINRFKKILPHSIIHSFEPVEERINIITNWLKTFPHNNNIILNHCAMGDKIEEKTFYVNGKTKNSSFLKLNEKNKQDHLKKEIKINVNTVDNYVKQNNIKYIDYLKIDTQGYEEEVLKGSIETLKLGIVKYIEVEIILSDYYEKTTNFYNMEKILLPLNYKLYHIQDIICKDGGQIEQIDALYKLR
jgi:FkbM family methyltransferase